MRKTDQKFHKIPDLPYRKNKKRTSAEQMMIQILNELMIEFEVEFPIVFASSYKLFDFKINGKDILIEVDGDYWHGNQENDRIKINYMHLKNKKNDMLKNIIAKKKGFKLIRVWETDLQDKYDEIKQMILKECA